MEAESLRPLRTIGEDTEQALASESDLHHILGHLHQAQAFMLEDRDRIPFWAVVRQIDAAREILQENIADHRKKLGKITLEAAGTNIHLTPKEKLVLAYVATGMKTAEIALAEGVGVHTIKFHLSNIYKKLGVENRTQAAAFAFREGLVASEASSSDKKRAI